MSRTCFGIRIDGTRPEDLEGPWNPDRYVAAVQYWLTRIMGTDTGKALLRELAPASRLVIKPDEDPVSPGTGPEDSQSVDAWRDAIREGTPARFGNGRMFGGFGTGQGTNVAIQFTPMDFFHSRPGEQPDMVLVHEICHATRYLAGIVSNQPMRALGFLTREEIHALLITNIYRSEQKLKEFRLSHRPSRYGTLKEAQTTFRLGPHVIRLMAGRQRQLFDDLASIETSFNVIREIIRNP